MQGYSVNIRLTHKSEKQTFLLRRANVKGTVNVKIAMPD